MLKPLNKKVLKKHNSLLLPREILGRDLSTLFTIEGKKNSGGPQGGDKNKMYLPSKALKNVGGGGMASCTRVLALLYQSDPMCKKL